MDIKSDIEKIKYILVIILFIFSCQTLTKKEINKADSVILYQIDSIKAAQEISDFILEFDSLFYFDSLGNMYAKHKVDSFLAKNKTIIKKIAPSDLVLDSQKLKEIHKCERCESKYSIKMKDFFYDDTLRQLQLWYSNEFTVPKIYYYQIDYINQIPIGGNPGEVSQMLEELSKVKK